MYILTEQKDSVLQITLNRPDVLNSFNEKMAMQMQQALRQASEDDGVRAVLLTGAGRAFCAGQDLAEVLPSAENPAPKTIGAIVNEHYNPIILAMRDLGKPIVVAINGVAAGAGANLALAGDFVFAAERASFIQAFSKIGLVPDSGGTFFLPRLVGIAKATELCMLASKLTAKEAADLNLIYKVSEDGNLMDDALTLTDKLAAMPTKSFAYIKQLLNCSFSNTLPQQLSAEAHFQSLAGETDDYQEGVQAFLEKRRPVYKGE